MVRDRRDSSLREWLVAIAVARMAPARARGSGCNPGGPLAGRPGRSRRHAAMTFREPFTHCSTGAARAWARGEAGDSTRARSCEQRASLGA